MIRFVEFCEHDKQQHVTTFRTLSDFKAWFKRYSFSNVAYVIFVGGEYYYNIKAFNDALECDVRDFDGE